jgi:hypothetical protein
MSGSTQPTAAGTPNLATVPKEQRQRLERDFAAYRGELPRLLAEGYGGRYVLIHQGQVVSVWDTQRDAIQVGCERFGLEAFAVNKVNPADVGRFAFVDSGREDGCPS